MTRSHWLSLVALLGILFSSLQSPALFFQPTPDAPLPSAVATLTPPNPPAEQASAPSDIPPDIEQALQDALASRVQAKSNEVAAFILYEVKIDRVFLTADGQTALLWLALVDPETGETLETEPGLAIARLNGDAKAPADWQITLQADSAFNEKFAALPDNLITDEVREIQDAVIAAAAEPEPKAVETFGGYKLPWAAGLSKRLTQSVNHIKTSCTNLPTCVYAFDFADGTHFPLLAAKGGTVKSFRTTCANDDHNCTNYLLLEDRSTTPTTYQLYYHMENNSVPQALRAAGTPVVQGQYIGNVDNTGYSTGSHLHFHVTKNGEYSFFSNIVDITFLDVAINGGRPRMCWEANAYPQYGTQCISGDKFTSDNRGANPPDGRITKPAANAALTDINLSIEGEAWDDIKVTRAQVIVNDNGNWREVGAPLTISSGKVTGSVNLCEEYIPNGSFEVALRLWDYEGNQTFNYPGRRTLYNNFTCRFDVNIDTPGAGSALESSTVSVSGPAVSDTGISSLKLLARQYGGDWKRFPVTFSGETFSTSLNLCSAGFGLGEIEMGLEVIDAKGKTVPQTPGLRTLVNRYACRLTAEISSPAKESTQSTETIPISGLVYSDTGISKVTVLARQNGDWKRFAASLSADRFSASINTCSAGFTPGPLTMAVEVTDSSGKVSRGLPGERTLVNNYNCSTPPKPACQPAANQVALFSEPNYGGVCALLGPGSYANASTFWPVGEDQAASLLVGSEALAALFGDINYGGRTESFERGDANLTDNLIGANSVSSLKVWQVNTSTSLFPAPDAPQLVQPSVNLGRAPNANDSIVLTWTGGAGATTFQSRLTYPDGTYKVFSWAKRNSLAVGNLPEGTYTWWVMGGNHLGTSYERRSNYPAITFSVQKAILPGSTPRALPYEDDLNSNSLAWISSGLWRWSNLLDGRQGWVYNNGSDYASGARSGDLTSPFIQLPSGSSYLTFDYLAQTEGSAAPYWDQRTVQISVGGAPFVDLLTLTDDAYDFWLTSKAIPLDAYAGKIVRIRFHFDALDGVNNLGYQGWMINSLRVLAGKPPALACAETSPNDSRATASSISIGAAVNASICPNGDVDYYKFSGSAGQRVSIAVDAQKIGSQLDASLFLLDEQGNWILMHDDLVPGEQKDPLLGFALPDTNTYYLRVQAWDHPSAGGSGYNYTLRLQADSAPPSLSLRSPQSKRNSRLPFDFWVDAADSGSGVKQVNFYWHDYNWATGRWMLLGSDADGSDGWKLPVSKDLFNGSLAAAFYVEAVDGAGNRAGIMLTNDALTFLPLLKN